MRRLSPNQTPHNESQPIPATQLLSGWALRDPLRANHSKDTTTMQPVKNFIPQFGHQPRQADQPVQVPAVRPVSAPATIADTRSGVAKYLDEVAPASIVGRLIKF